MTGTLARRSAQRNLRRTAAAATALAIGVAVVTLFTVYAASLRTADISGVGDSFTGDIAISTGGFGGGGSGGGLSPALARTVAKVPGVVTVSGLLKGQALVGGRSADVTAVIPATIGQVLDLHPAAGSIGRLAPGQIAVSQVEADDRGWHLGSPASLVLPDGTRAQVTVGAIYTSRNLAGDTVVPIRLWAPHALQLTASVLLVKLAPGVMREQIGRLIAAACQPKIVLQVLPAGSGAHPGLAGQFVIAGFDGAADVAYLDNDLAGQVVERAGDVARVTLLYDILKAEALPRQASIDLAREAIERWT